jgi:P-type conjugative transfer protein TrbJ
LLVAGAWLMQPTVAEAVIPVVDVAHIAQTVLHYAARLRQIANQVRQIANQYEQIRLKVQSLKKLEDTWWRDIGRAMSDMEWALGGGELPSHLSPYVRSIHAETYQGWQPPENWWTEEEQTAERTLATLRETLWAKQLQHRTTRGQMRTLDEIKRQMVGIEGHQEAIEMLATLSAFQTEAEILAQLSAQTSADAATAYYSYFVNLRARQEASIQQALLTSTSFPPPLSGGWGALPGWWH